MNLRHLLSTALLASWSLAARAQVYYTVEENGDVLCTVDVATGTLTAIGPLGSAYAFGDLAYDTSTGTMYLSDGWGQGINIPSSLYTVDLATGLATLVGSTGVTDIFGLVYDPQTDKLFASSATFAPHGVYEIDRASGFASFVGDPGQELDGLTFVGSTGALVGLTAGTGSIHAIDRVSGASTPITPGAGFVNNCGIAWAPATDDVYAIDWSGKLYAYDVVNGWSRTLVASGLPPCDGLALAIPPCPQPVPYCTAGTTTNGCVPSISSTGSPKLGQTSGFSIDVSSLEGQRAAIVFYGIDNTSFTPTSWALGSTSFLCVKAPAQRTTVQNSGGAAGACDGQVSLDWLAYMAANPGALGAPVVAGQVYYGQVWFRDPPAPKTTNLSNALEWTLCP
jgi:hypothetical protein